MWIVSVQLKVTVYSNSKSFFIRLLKFPGGLRERFLTFHDNRLTFSQASERSSFAACYTVGRWGRCQKEHNRGEGTLMPYTLNHETVFPSGFDYLRSQAAHSIIF